MKKYIHQQYSAIYYDNRPRYRYWRVATTVAEGAVLTIKCIPVQSCKLIIVFFGGVEYAISHPRAL